MFKPICGNFDQAMTEDMKRTPNAVVGWLLMASWCYYIEATPCSLLSDTLYDKACGWLLRHYASVTHKYKHLLPPEALSAGSAYHLGVHDYPGGIIRMAQLARDELEKYHASSI